ncbi:unnamed protein product, partial [Cochlearia groenlandica]
RERILERMREEEEIRSNIYSISDRRKIVVNSSLSKFKRFGLSRVGNNEITNLRKIV